MNRIYKRVLVALTLLFSTVSAYAHHSFSATFTKDKLVEVEGKVTDFRFRNPHVCLLYTSPSPRDRTRSRMPSSA